MNSNLKREDLYDTKVNVSNWDNDEKSALQKLAFELGFQWGCIPRKECKRHDAYAYYFYKLGLQIKYEDGLCAFNDTPFRELTFPEIFSPKTPEAITDNFEEEFDAKINEQNRLKTKTSLDILAECARVQNDRGMDYDTDDNQKERSFNATSQAFNAITGKDITPAEVCLMLQIVKDVRQWSQDRLHEDSVLDGVSYASLKGEELYKQYGDNK